MTMNIVASGVVLVAVALLIRQALDVRASDWWGFVRQAAGVAGQRQGGGLPASERGITLQTLIVTAVLVLVAVVAGVVIVAITNSSSDDLEEQSQDLEGRCTGTELHDLELEIAGVTAERGYSAPPGSNLVKGSAVGCIPVCFWDDSNPTDGKINSGEISFKREWNQTILVGDPSGPPVVAGGLTFNNEVHEAGGITALFVDSTTIGGDNLVGVGYREVTISSSAFDASLVGAAEVRVAPDGENCYIYNSNGEIVD